MTSILWDIIILFAIIVSFFYLVRTNTLRWENKLVQKNNAQLNWEAANQKRRRFMERNKDNERWDYSTELNKLLREEIYLYMNFLKAGGEDSRNNYSRMNELLKMLSQNERRVVLQNLFLQYPDVMGNLGFTFLDIPEEWLGIFDDNNENGWE